MPSLQSWIPVPKNSHAFAFMVSVTVWGRPVWLIAMCNLILLSALRRFASVNNSLARLSSAVAIYRSFRAFLENALLLLVLSSPSSRFLFWKVSQFYYYQTQLLAMGWNLTMADFCSRPPPVSGTFGYGSKIEIVFFDHQFCHSVLSSRYMNSPESTPNFNSPHPLVC